MEIVGASFFDFHLPFTYVNLIKFNWSRSNLRTKWISRFVRSSKSSHKTRSKIFTYVQMYTSTC